MQKTSPPCDALIIVNAPDLGEALAPRMIGRAAHFGLLPGWWLRPASADVALAVCDGDLPEAIAATRHLLGALNTKRIVSLSWAIPADDALHEGDVVLATGATAVSFPPFLPTQSFYESVPPDPLAPRPALVVGEKFETNAWSDGTYPKSVAGASIVSGAVGTAVAPLPPFHAGAYARDVFQVAAVETLACAVAEAARLDNVQHYHASIIASETRETPTPWPSRQRAKLAQAAAPALVTMITRLLANDGR